jgi:hypothetical protein
MLKLETKADLERLVHDKIQESLTLEYKDSRALEKQDRQRDELCKDVSAFANSAGGQIVYGIKELDREPKGLDSGAPNNQITREWIEQVIDSNVQPRIDGLVITPIPFDDSNTGYVLTIPQAVVRAPHQAPDHKYYKRQNFQSMPMEDYEIRDALRRATNAEPFVSISFVGALTKIDVELEHGTEHSKPIELQGIMGNASSQPAYYSVFNFYLDDRLIVASPAGLDRTGHVSLSDGSTLNRYVKKIGIPGSFPLFKEMTFGVFESPFSFRVPNLMLDRGLSFFIGYDIRTPGYHVTQFGRLLLPMKVLELTWQPIEVNRSRAL